MTHKTLGRLLSLLLRQPLQLILVCLGSLIQVGLSVVLPVVIGRVIDHIGQPKALLSPLLGQMLGLLLGIALLQWMLPYLHNQLVYRLVASLRTEAYAILHRLPLSYLDRQSVGDLVGRFAADAEQLTNGLLMVFSQFFIGILTILLTLLSMARLDGTMMLMVVSLTPVSLVVAGVIAKKSYATYQNQTRSRGEQAQLLEESIRQLTLVQTAQAQDQLLEQFRQQNKVYARHSQEAIFLSSTVNPLTRCINALIYALLAGCGAWRIIHGQLTVGELTTFLQYATQYSKPFTDISSVFSEVQSALVCAERLFDLIDQETEKERTSHLALQQPVAGEVTFRQLSFRYEPDTPLIEEVNLHVPAGSKVAIVGPTGAGKSTLVNLLMRFYDPDSGQILLDGLDSREISRTSLRQQIGMVLQETWMKSGTIHEAIAYGYPAASREEVIAAAKAAKADFFIRQLPQGYDTLLKAGEQTLSQGQYQLLSIARLFVHLPQILLLDEATSSIDTRTECLIQEAFSRLMEGRTSFVIAHRLSTIQSADFILVMVAGQIVEQGTHASLMAAKGTYYAMQTSQQESS